MVVLAVTHGPTVRSELFGEVVREAGHELVEWEITERGAPRSNGYGAVMVFGGVMNVGEELEHPWLRDEYTLLRSWLAEGTPLLGVCLGAQTLAHAAGGEVTRLPAPQVGFVELELTDAGREDPVLGVFPPRFRALFGNEYRFALPEGAVDLARGNDRSQAYRLGERAWAVQFHPEVRRDQVLRWWSNGRELPKPIDELEADVDEHLAEWQARGRALCGAFLRQAP